MSVENDSHINGDTSERGVDCSENTDKHTTCYEGEDSGTNLTHVRIDFDKESTSISNNTESIPSKSIEENKVMCSDELSRKKKIIVFMLVVLLCAIPFLHAIFNAPTDNSTVITLKDPELDNKTYFEGTVAIEPSYVEDSVKYNFKYTGTDESCTWYICCNEDTAKIPSNKNVVDRGYTNIGSGTDIVVSDDILHIGSYKLKLVTENNEYTDENIIIDGNVTAKYTWPFIGENGIKIVNNIQLEYAFKDYYSYATNMSIGRDDYENIDKYAVIDPYGVIDNLVKLLTDEFSKHYPSLDTRGDWFANYMLSFVQQCMNYPEWGSQSDEYIYGRVDYFAYPIETIFHNTGDCEDTSILLSAMYDCAGYDAAITLLYAYSEDGNVIGHSSSAVNMDKTISKHNINKTNFAEAKMQSKDGKVYYLCETTVAYQLAAGFIQSKYLNDEMNMNAIFPITVNDG